MAKEKITPTSKNVPSSGGVKDADHSHLTTPKKDTENRTVGWHKEAKESIL